MAYQTIVPGSVDETTQRLIVMTNETCLIALDKTLAAIYRARERRVANPWTVAVNRVTSIAERIVRAAEEVSQTLPLEQRACSHPKK